MFLGLTPLRACQASQTASIILISSTSSTKKRTNKKKEEKGRKEYLHE